MTSVGMGQVDFDSHHARPDAHIANRLERKLKNFEIKNPDFQNCSNVELGKEWGKNEDLDNKCKKAVMCLVDIGKSKGIMRPKNDNCGVNNDYFDANGDDRGNNNDCYNEVYEPEYRMFLENVKEKGNSFALKAGKQNGSPILLKYDGIDDSQDERDLNSFGKGKNVIEADNVGKGLDVGNTRDAYMVENLNALDSVEENGENGRTKSSNENDIKSGPLDSVSVPLLQNEFSNQKLSMENSFVLKSLDKCDTQGGSHVKPKKRSMDLRSVTKRKKEEVAVDLEDMIEGNYEYFLNYMTSGKGKNAIEADNVGKGLDLANIRDAYMVETLNALDSVEENGENGRTKSSNEKNIRSGPLDPVAVPLLQNEFSNQNLSMENSCVLKSLDKCDIQGGSSVKRKRSVENLRTVTKRNKEDVAEDLKDMIDEDYEYFLNYIYSPKKRDIKSDYDMEDQKKRGRKNSTTVTKRKKEEVAEDLKDMIEEDYEYFLNYIYSPKKQNIKSNYDMEDQKKRGRKNSRTVTKRKEKEVTRVLGSVIEEDYKFFLDNLQKTERGDIKFHYKGCLVEYEDDSDSEVSVIDTKIFAKDGTFNQFVPSEGICATVTEDDIECLDRPSGSFPSQFRGKLLSVLQRPYDQSEYKRLWHDISNRKPIENEMSSANRKGKSYLDHYGDLKRKLKAAKNDRNKKLNLLRGFFFYLQNVTQEGSFRPWKDISCLAVMPASP